LYLAQGTFKSSIRLRKKRRDSSWYPENFLPINGWDPVLSLVTIENFSPKKGAEKPSMNFLKKPGSVSSVKHKRKPEWNLRPTK
jgi:hypothetical protein